MSPSILTGVPPTIESVSPGRDMPGSADDRDLLRIKGASTALYGTSNCPRFA
jgi:hypothetical protein